MSDFDLSHLPKGELGRLALLEYARSSDDRVERYFLEVKSDIDLGEKSGWSKVAKFVLGAANRDPLMAARRFDGHAVMLLGVSGGGEAAGIPSFEAMDLRREVSRWIGADGPTWDFERIPVDAERDVIMIIADPPTGEMWACWADGPAGLVDGGIYVRADGETRRATGEEIRQMVRRMREVVPDLDVTVEVLGEVYGVRIDENALLATIDQAADAMLPEKPVKLPRHLQTTADLLRKSDFARDRRSEAAYMAEVERWRQELKDDPLAGVRDLVAHQASGIRIRATNNKMRFLSDVRIEVEFDQPVRALAWLDEYEPEDDFDLLPGKPIPWGRDSSFMSALAGMGPIATISVRHDVAVEQELPAVLSLELPSLRPGKSPTTPEDEIVLMMLPADSRVEVVTGQWSLTAAGVHGEAAGRFEIPVNWVDLDVEKLLG